jgi:predicted N-acyltransferase
MSQHIFKIQSKHEGRSYVRLIQTLLQFQDPLKNISIMVFESLRELLLGRHLGTVGLQPIILKGFEACFYKALTFFTS